MSITCLFSELVKLFSSNFEKRATEENQGVLIVKNLELMCS